MEENGIIEVFSKCTTCGIDGAKIRRIRQWATSKKILFVAHRIDYKNPSSMSLQAQYQEKIGLPISRNISIVVENGNKVTRLSEWNKHLQ